MIPSFFSKAHYRIPATIRVKPRPLNCTDSPDGKKSHLFQPFAASEKGSLIKVIGFPNCLGEHNFGGSV